LTREEELQKNQEAGLAGWAGPESGDDDQSQVRGVESRIGKTREGQSNSFGRALPLPRSEGLMLIEGLIGARETPPRISFFRAHTALGDRVARLALARRVS
jgi:hypothetical protein